MRQSGDSSTRVMNPPWAGAATSRLPYVTTTSSDPGNVRRGGAVFMPSFTCQAEHIHHPHVNTHVPIRSNLIASNRNRFRIHKSVQAV